MSENSLDRSERQDRPAGITRPLAIAACVVTASVAVAVVAPDRLPGFDSVAAPISCDDATSDVTPC